MYFLDKLTFANRIKTARIFFIFSALYGLFLRFLKITTIFPVTYKHILEGHSHVAFLGWGFLAVITLIDFAFLNNSVKRSKYLKILYLLMAFSILGMLFSFPFQGYHFFSILFLSVFLIVSYLYLWKTLQLLQKNTDLASRFIKSGIYFYFLSSIAIWSIGIIAIKIGKQILYYDTIYFYMHFLYNGFFVFSLFGLLYRYIQKNKIPVKSIYLKRFYWFTLAACIPAYALSLLWVVMPNYVYVIAFIAGFLQLISLFYLFGIVKMVFKKIPEKWIRLLFFTIIVSYFFKITFQFLSVFPFFMHKAIQLKPFFIIGYLHLFTLGFMSLFIILLLVLLPKVNLSKIGIFILVLGILLSELLLFGQGILMLFSKGIPNLNAILFSASILMPLGILIIHFRKKSIR